MVVEKPVTFVLYNQFPFVRPYWILNRFVPEYGAQLIKILVGLILLDSIMFGATIVLPRTGQIGAAVPPVPLAWVRPVVIAAGPPIVPVAHVFFVMVVPSSIVTAPVESASVLSASANSLPFTVEPVLAVIVVAAITFPTIVLESPIVAEEPTCQ